MPITTTTPKPPTSDAAVVKATGRDWAEWCRLLDQEGAVKMTHAEIARLVDEKFNGGNWWSQMVTVGYEQLRGLRVRHQKADGFEISRTKTIPAPVERVYRAWATPAQRRRWLADPAIAVTTATDHKTMRFTWIDGKTRAVAYFADKGGKTSVTVQHIKLANAKAAAKMKEYWGVQLDALAEHVSSLRG